MKQYFYTRILGMAFLLLVSISCTSNLDFNQANNVSASPIVVANLAAFDVQANQFVSGGIEQTVSVAVPNFEVFRDTFFRDNLIKTDLFFEINNTINRAFTLELEMLDSNNLPLYHINIDVPAYSGAEKLVTKTEIFENTNLDLLKRTAKIGFKITMLPGAALTESSTGSLKLQSSATVYLGIK